MCTKRLLILSATIVGIMSLHNMRAARTAQAIMPGIGFGQPAPTQPQGVDTLKMQRGALAQKLAALQEKAKHEKLTPVEKIEQAQLTTMVNILDQGIAHYAGATPTQPQAADSLKAQRDAQTQKLAVLQEKAKHEKLTPVEEIEKAQLTMMVNVMDRGIAATQSVR